MRSPLDREFEPDRKVVVYRDGHVAYEGRWADRDDEYDGTWYLLADVEDADILIVAD